MVAQVLALELDAVRSYKELREVICDAFAEVWPTRRAPRTSSPP